MAGHTLKQKFSDYATRNDVVTAVTKGDISAAIRVIESWRETMPDVGAVVDTVASQMPFTPYTRGMIMAAGKLAAEPLENVYHGNRHSLEVFLVTSVLACHAHREGRLSLPHLGLLLTAALIHDYKHDGTSNFNPKTNRNDQLKLEGRAVEAAVVPLFGAYGINWHDWNTIEHFVYATDVSFDPALRKTNPTVYRSVADGVKLYLVLEGKGASDPDVLHYRLRQLHDTKLVDAAQMLQDADVATAYLNTKIARQSGQYFAAERGTDFTDDQVRGFLTDICYGKTFSVSGQALIQPFLNETMKSFGLTVRPAPKQTAAS